jgi:hypothetical protein
VSFLSSGGLPLDDSLTLEELLALPGLRTSGHLASVESLQAYGVGTLLVEAIVARSRGSFALLHRACAERAGDGRLSPRTLLDLAGFGSADEFEAWLDRELAEEAARRFLSGRESLEWIGYLEETLELALDARTFLDLDPVYQLAERAPVRLSERPDLQELVKSRWPQRER